MNSLYNICSRFNKNCLFLFKSSKEFTLVVRSGNQNSGCPKWAAHGRYFHPVADHMTKLKKFGEICEFSVFPFSVQLMFDQTLSNSIVCLMISQKNTFKSCTNELAGCSGY